MMIERDRESKGRWERTEQDFSYCLSMEKQTENLHTWFLLLEDVS